jgi:hypothetical protein
MNLASSSRLAQPSPTSFEGGKALRATLRLLHGESQAHEYISCLDSGSDVNLANRHLLHDVHPIDVEELSNCGAETPFREEGTLRVFLSGAVVCVPALVATKAQLPFGCEGVKLDAHREKKLRRLECNVGEKALRTWLETNGTQEVVKVSFDVAEVVVNPDLPAALQKRFRSLLAEYADVFAGEQNSLPKPFAAEPVIEPKFVPTQNRRLCPSLFGPTRRSKF